MGRAEERRARQQRGGRRAAPKRSSRSAATGTTETADTGARSARGTKGGKNGKSFLRRLFTWKKILGTVLGLALLGMGAFVVLYLTIDVPAAGNEAAKLQSNIYKYSDGTVLARTGTVNREIVDLSEVPKKVQQTFVAAENKSFYKDSGVDLKGTTRGLINTLSGKGKQGGSTITQQYVKNYYLDQDQTITRKLKELVISLKVDQEKTKDFILAGDINTNYYGRDSYGIQAAAQAYYRVDAKDLSVEQGAYLAALLQAPSQYDWAVASKTGKELVTARWNYVLDNMVEEGWLDQAARAAMKFPVPKDPKGAPDLEGQTGYLVDAAKKELAKQLEAQGTASDAEDANALVDAGGWTITLNIDRKKQAALEQAAKSELTSKLDAKKRKVDGYVQAGAASVDPKTGRVLALYGGTNFFDHYVSNATRRDYQPASTFKPIILAAAMEQKARTQDGDLITPDTIYDGTSGRQVVDDGKKVGFGPPNEDDEDYGDVTVQTAMNKSINSVFAQMGVDVGMTEVMKVADELGLDTTGLQAVPAQTLGTMGASPLEMAGVYATLDNHGRKVTPAVVKSAEHKDATADFPSPLGEQIITREAADAVTSVLTGVVDDGTARVSVAQAKNRKGQQVAGKTGTSDENKSAWFTGYTPSLVTSVGLFGENTKANKQVSLTGATGLIPAGGGRINGGGYPAKIWATYTFGAMGKVTKFDLDTTLGAGVKPTPTPTPTLIETPSATPSEKPSPTPSPTLSPTPTPTLSPTPTPTLSPTPTPTPTFSPPATPTSGDGDITLEPPVPDDDQ